MKKNFVLSLKQKVFFSTQPNFPLLHLSNARKSGNIVHQTLIQGCLSGNRASQNELYQLFAPDMFTVCLRYGKDRHQAEEILQEGFIKVFASLNQFRNEGSLEGWIRRVIVTTALQHLRTRIPLHAVISVDNKNEYNLKDDEHIESGLSAKELLALVQSLPLTYRTVFNLYVFEGYKHKEIAELLRISEGTSKSNLYDARQWLKEKIQAVKRFDNPKRHVL